MAHHRSRASLAPDAPFLDPDLFPFLAPLRERWREIEAGAAASCGTEAIPGFQEIAPDQYRIAAGTHWRTFVLFRFGDRLESDCAQMPVTADRGDERTALTAGAPAPETLEALVSGLLDRAVGAEARAMADDLAARPGVLAVLFYGNRLRRPSAPGLLDFYVLTAGDAVWSGPGISALANRLLPPNVYHVEVARPAPAPPVAAKVAVLRLAAFRARMRRQTWDTTLWARFAQPVALLYARDAETRRAVIAAVAAAWRTAAWWADRLSSGTGRWAALFAATYGAELRVEDASRSAGIVRAAPDLYAAIDRLLPPVRPEAAEIGAARRAWRRRQAAGRALNALRLAKAALTFRCGMDYALAKLERHAGPGALTAWERRFPWLAAPGVIGRLLRRRGIR